MAVATPSWRTHNELLVALVALVAIALMVATPASAQKLYKVVDEKGNISYQDTPPMDENLKVEEKHVDVNGSKLRRDAPTQKRKFVPNTGSRRRVAAPSRSGGANSGSTGEDTSFEIPDSQLVNQNPLALGGAAQGRANQEGGGVPTNSDALRHHFDPAKSGNQRSRDGNNDPFQRINASQTERKKPAALTTDELADIVRKLE